MAGFATDQLPLYWTQPDRRFAFFIRSGQDRVGVALATRESATNDAPEHLDVAEFFVLPAHRGQGVGRQAASLLWDRLPGHWVVRVSQANVAALSFWRHTVQSYTGGTFSVSERPGRLGRWQVFSFRTAARPVSRRRSTIIGRTMRVPMKTAATGLLLLAGRRGAGAG